MTERIAQLANRLPALELLADYQAVVSNDGCTHAFRHPYYAGVRLARLGHWQAAESALQQAGAADAACPEFRTAAHQALAEVYRCWAEEQIAAGSYTDAVARLTHAQALDAGNPRVNALFAQLGSILPVLSIINGKREEAHARWTEDFQRNPQDVRATHSLAVLLLYGGQEALAQHRLNDALAAWESSGEYWSLLLRAPAFRQFWIATKTAVYGREITPEDIEKACQYASAQILRTIADAASTFRTQGDDASYAKVMRSYGIVLGELRAAELFASALAQAGGDAVEKAVIGGPRVLERLGQLANARQWIEKAAAGLEAHEATRLRMAFSGRAPQWGLVEAKLFEQVISELEQVKSRSPEQSSLLAQAYFERGVLLRDEQYGKQAFSYWCSAMALLKANDPLGEEIEKFAIAVAKQVVDNWQKPEGGGLNALTQIIDSMKALFKYLKTPRFRMNLSAAIRALAIHAYNQKNASRGNALLREALEIHPENVAVKCRLSNKISNQAVDKVNDALERLQSNPYVARETLKSTVRTAVKEFFEALDLDPNNQHARTQLVSLIDVMKPLEMYSEALQVAQRLKG